MNGASGIDYQVTRGAKCKLVSGSRLKKKNRRRYVTWRSEEKKMRLHGKEPNLGLTLVTHGSNEDWVWGGDHDLCTKRGGSLGPFRNENPVGGGAGGGDKGGRSVWGHVGGSRTRSKKGVTTTAFAKNGRRRAGGNAESGAFGMVGVQHHHGE